MSHLDMGVAMTQQFFFWLAIAFLFLLGELGNPGLFFFISFACGALVSAVVSFWTAALIVQMTIFLVITVISIILLRTLLSSYTQVQIERHYYSNVDALVGKKALVIKTIKPDQAGQVRIQGEIWAARADIEIASNTHVEIVAVRGAHVQVRIIHQ